MFGRKSDGWWIRELERVNRAHASERAAWDAERAALIDTVCRLAEKPAYTDDGATLDEPENTTFDAFNDPDGIGHELVDLPPEED